MIVQRYRSGVRELDDGLHRGGAHVLQRDVRRARLAHARREHGLEEAATRSQHHLVVRDVLQ